MLLLGSAAPRHFTKRAHNPATEVGQPYVQLFGRFQSGKFRYRRQFLQLAVDECAGNTLLARTSGAFLRGVPETQAYSPGGFTRRAIFRGVETNLLRRSSNAAGGVEPSALFRKRFLQDRAKIARNTSRDLRGARKCRLGTLRDNPQPQGGSMELVAYAAESWFTAEGARLKARRLQQAGIPDLTNWRFITLTIAGHSRPPLEAYYRGKDQIRRFLARFRRAIGRDFKWCWKLEFQEDGYAHWHLLVEYTRPVPVEMLPTIEKWWGLGRINIKRVNHWEMAYVFKYVAKGIEDLPMWVVRFKGRLRVFQASRGFYTRRKSRTVKKQEPIMSLVKVNLLTRRRWDERKAVLVKTNTQGQRRISVVKLRMTFSSLVSARAWEAQRRRVSLDAPGTVSLSQLQSDILTYETRKFAGLAGIPANATAS